MQKQTKNNTQEAGHILSFFSGVAKLTGLPHVFLHEVLVDVSGKRVALVLGFRQNFVEALFFDESFDLEQLVFRSGELFSVPIAEHTIGRITDGFGLASDGLGDMTGEMVKVFRQAPPIFDREPVTTPLSTGIKIIDTSLPLGRGQRELIIGDRKLGKSTLAIDIVLNQRHVQSPVYCIYVLCGQKESKVQEVVALFEKHNAFLYTTVVASTAGASFAEQYLAPFVGCSIGEYFRDRGKDVLIIYDDLSSHAKAYRDIALLLERAPGREAYPGDVFSLHAGLLERAAKLSEAKGGGSLTALPIVETQEGDITSFIPTNIISITDGQIYLERDLFEKGYFPAINIGLSVSRIGSQAQPKVLRSVVGGIRLGLSQHKELMKLTQLETVVSDEAKEKIHHGELILELLKQRKHTNVSWPEQVILFYTIKAGLFDDIEKEKWSSFETLLLELIRSVYPIVLEEIEMDAFDAVIKNKIKQITEDFKQEFEQH